MVVVKISEKRPTSLSTRAKGPGHYSKLLLYIYNMYTQLELILQTIKELDKYKLSTTIIIIASSYNNF